MTDGIIFLTYSFNSKLIIGRDCVAGCVTGLEKTPHDHKIVQFHVVKIIYHVSGIDPQGFNSKLNILVEFSHLLDLENDSNDFASLNPHVPYAEENIQ